MTSIDRPATSSHRGGQGREADGAALTSELVGRDQAPGVSRRCARTLRSASPCVRPVPRAADECPVGGAEGANDFEPGHQVGMPSCQPFPGVPGFSPVEHYHPQSRKEAEQSPERLDTGLQLGCARLTVVDGPGLGVPGQRFIYRYARTVQQGLRTAPRRGRRSPRSRTLPSCWR
jgi:hypothetical protein